MKKKHLLIAIISLLVHSQIPAQVMLVAVKPGDCPKCQITLSLLKPVNTHIPTYVVFESSLYRDKDEIEEQLEFKKNHFVTIYSDELLQKMKTNIKGTALMIDAEHQVIWKKDLADVTQDDAKLVSAKYKALSRNTNDDVLRYREGKLYHYNYAINKLSVYDNSDTSFYSLKNNSRKKFIGSIVSNLDTELYNNFIHDNPQFKPTFVSYFLGANKTLYIMSQVYIPKKRNDTTIVDQLSAICKYKNEKLEAIYPISSPDHIPEYTINNFSFFIKNDSILYINGYQWSKPPLTSNKTFISVFKLNRGQFTYEKQLKIPLPDIYIKKLGFNFISFLSMDYPYMILPLGEEIYDIEKEKKYSITLNKKIDFSNISLDKLATGSNEPIMNEYVEYDNNNNRIYLVSKITGETYLHIINCKDFSTIKSVSLKKLLPSMRNHGLIKIDTQKEKILFIDKGGSIRTFPLNLVYYNIG